MSQLHARISHRYTQQHTRCQVIKFDLKPCDTRTNIQLSDNEIAAFIIDCVHKMFGVSLDTMRLKTRKRPIVKSRQIAIYLINKHTDMHLTENGRIFGFHEHTSPLHCCQTVADLMSTDKEYAHELTQLETKIKYKI